MAIKFSWLNLFIKKLHGVWKDFFSIKSLIEKHNVLTTFKDILTTSNQPLFYFFTHVLDKIGWEARTHFFALLLFQKTRQ